MKILREKKDLALFLFIGLFGLASFFLVGINTSQAQEIRPIITWQAMNFYPSNYQGKAIAVQGTPVVVSAAFLRNGQLIDPSNSELRWRVDGSVFRSGTGINEVTLNMVGSRGTHRVLVEGSVNGESIRESINIPRQRPSLVIEAPYPTRTMFGQPIIARAVPYFFNVNSLDEIRFFWSVNNVRREVGGNRLVIEQNDPVFIPGRTILISASASKKDRMVEKGQSSVRINILE